MILFRKPTFHFQNQQQLFSCYQETKLCLWLHLKLATIHISVNVLVGLYPRSGLSHSHLQWLNNITKMIIQNIYINLGFVLEVFVCKSFRVWEKKRKTEQKCLPNSAENNSENWKYKISAEFFGVFL